MNPPTALTPTDTRFFQPRRAAFWLLVAFLAYGSWFAVAALTPGFRTVPTTMVAGVIGWTLFTVPILFFFRKIGAFRLHPPAGFALAFAWGGLAAVFMAIPANQAVFGLCAKLVSPEFCATWGPAMAGPTNEEPLKLIGVALIVIMARERFQSVLSVMVLGAMVGLGFQVVEDLFYTANTSLNYSSPDQLTPVLSMLLVRGFFSGLWSHTAYTTVASFGLGYAFVHREQPLSRRVLVAAAALTLSWALHCFWNSPLLGDALMHGLMILLYFPVKGLPVFLAALLLWRTARREALAT
jgi:RsiW-degrading membrane proteinase PrsW (M82 family)